MKIKKNVKIYQYITVNTKNITSTIVKGGLKTDSDSKTKDEIITKQKLNIQGYEII